MDMCKSVSVVFVFRLCADTYRDMYICLCEKLSLGSTHWMCVMWQAVYNNRCYRLTFICIVYTHARKQPSFQVNMG